MKQLTEKQEAVRGCKSDGCMGGLKRERPSRGRMRYHLQKKHRNFVLSDMMRVGNLTDV